AGAGAVVFLDAARVILAGGEIEVVMAGAAREARRLGQPDVVLRGLLRRVASFVAEDAVADVLSRREIDAGEVDRGRAEADDLVLAAGLDARQVRAVVDLVDH